MHQQSRQLRVWILFTGMVAAGVAAWFHLSPAALGQAPARRVADADAMMAERGKYLVAVAGCSDCHTPMKMTAKGPAPDMERMLSGHPEAVKLPEAPKPQGPWIWSGAATSTAFAGPWGITYAANLTPDKNTGLGIWTQDMFVSALRTGKHWGQPGARDIQPPMPWKSYSQMTTDDLKAIYAYLQTLPPVANHVPDYQPAE